jgi:hypothetical protein
MKAPPLIVACVRTGDKYPFFYVERLRAGVERHLPLKHEFVVITDRPSAPVSAGYVTMPITDGLPGWWGKMALFQSAWRAGRRVIYLDLDTVIVGDLMPLALLDCDFGICENFTRRAGHRAWPCSLGSCVMVLSPRLDASAWLKFCHDRDDWMSRAGKLGDQWVIEALLGERATLLQEVMPPGFFLGRRELEVHRARAPAGAALINFAGPMKPHNCTIPWIREAWHG